MRRSILRLGLFVILCVPQIGTTAAVANAQTSPEAATTCFAGRPMPRCKTFWLTEWGYFRPGIGTDFVETNEAIRFERPYLNDHMAWEIGVMSNRRPRTAVGATVQLGISGSGGRIGLKGRHRSWLSEKGVLDVSAGVLRAGMNAPYPDYGVHGYGITGDIALGWRDWAAVAVRGDVLRSNGRTVNAMYGGVRFGSHAGIVATAVVAAYFVLLAAAYGGGT